MNAMPTTQSPAASADEVLALLREICLPLETESVSLRDACGRVLREPVRAPEDQPAFDRSSVDGYAVRLDDDAEAFHIADEIRAGEWKLRQLQRGEAVRIATGGALPCDGLRVVMKENVTISDGNVCVLRREPERNIRFRGEDAHTGQTLVDVGTLLQPGALGLLASVGHTQPIVTRLPRLVHLATGSEIVAPESQPQHGQIRDSNSTLVRAFLNQRGIEPRQFRVPEDVATAHSTLEAVAADTDLLLVSGGASVGEHDFTRQLFERRGYEILVSKTTARPGKPLIVAQRGNALAFGLPGNPLAHFVCLNLYVRAALDAFAGLPNESPFQRGTLAAGFDAGGNRRETFWPARCRANTLTPLRWSSSGDLTSLSTANALIRVSSGTRQLGAGSAVEFVLTGTVL
jgi:molybdopterin molybdotransferase